MDTEIEEKKTTGWLLVIPFGLVSLLLGKVSESVPVWWVRLILTVLAAVVLIGAWSGARGEGLRGLSSNAWVTIILAHAAVVVPALALVLPT
ncbi:hypothetical protein [Nocardiopsis halophila]|uniref:hypothetical protein n=1 Tax=Nocardiopsis halophila TaxID=141692 RepID=UPI00036E9940|nr:hypothetical protein [Nocardiopsis halophila]